MFSHETRFRVRYGETDKMGYVYYGNYPLYYEVGRVEAFRSLGTNYSDMEHNGVGLPVKHMEIKYHRPAFYDELLTLKTSIMEMPSSRIKFHHELYNSKGELINTGIVELVFINIETKKPVRCPEYVSTRLQEYFA